LLYLRRRIKAEPRPFSPIASRPRSHVKYHRFVAEIRAIELRLLDHLRQSALWNLPLRAPPLASLRPRMACLSPRFWPFSTGRPIAKVNAYRRAQEEQKADGNLPTALKIVGSKTEKAK
jgi:hypothetical protein